MMRPFRVSQVLSPEFVEQRRADRLSLLCAAYALAQGDPEERTALSEVAALAQVPAQDLPASLHFLERANLILLSDAEGEPLYHGDETVHVGITTEGALFVEEAVRTPQQATEVFPAFATVQNRFRIGDEGDVSPQLPSL